MRSLLDSLSAWEAAQPGKVAYRFLEQGDVDGEVSEISYGRLGARVRAIGGWLQANGHAGTRALLLYPPGLEFVSGYMGCLFGGVVPAPCPAPQRANFDRELPRLKSLVADAGAELVLSTEPVLSEMRAMASTVPELASLAWIATEDVPDAAADDWRRPDLRPDSLAFLQYTSGSTSTPRGVMVTHANLMDQQRVLTELLGHQPDVRAAHDGDLLVSWLPVFHDLGLIGVVIHAAYLGETAAMLSPAHFVQRPERWLRAMSAYRASTSGGPNFGFELCVRRATPELVESLDLRRWRVAFNCAEPVRASTLRRFSETFAPAGFRSRALLPSWGLAEATLAVTGGGVDEEPRIVSAPADPSNPDGPGRREIVGVGRAVPGMSVVVVDPERAEPLPDGEEGEVWVAGGSVAAGYWNDPEATRELFGARLADGRGGFLRTGDLGFLDEDGELYVTGRAKDLLIVDGRNHYPQDLELTAELAHPAVRPGCVTAFSIDADDGERAVVVAEVAPERAPDPGVVRRAVAAAITAQHGVEPHDIALIRPRTIFKTSSGKLQRRATRKAYLDGGLALFEPPAEGPAAVEAWLVDALARRLARDPAAVDRDRPIAEYGLGSRALVELTADLSEVVGRELDPTLLYDHPTIAQVARAVGPLAAPAARRARPVAEPIAIVSMACRLPGADSPEELWRLLAAGEDAVGDPAERWDADALYDPDPDAAGKAYTLQGGYLRDVDRFDAAFFGISPREAAAMDPQQRLLLEASWEAFERAGIRPHELGGSATGVYVGLYDSGYSAGVALDRLEGHTATGSASSVASGRIAYTLGLQGPAVTLDTACSSSLVAIHMAAQALRGGECDLALAGGATVMATPRAHVEFSRLRGLSPSGRCRAFSADADGMVWAEGCGLLVLKRLGDAERDGDRVLALIEGSAVNQDGRSQGLSAPNGLAQEAVVRAALAAAEVRPEDVDYVEAHGTGTPLGDPIEGRALARVFGASRRPERPLRVGSLKSNIGHAQAAAGVAGVIKTVLALRHEQLPPSLHAGVPTPRIDWSEGLELVASARPWPRLERPRRAGVSSFGISGTNAHLVLAEAPAAEPAAAGGEAGGGEPLAFPLSARGPRALAAHAERLADALERAPGLALGAVARTLACHRTHFERRAVVVARERGELVSGLRALAAGRPEPDLVAGPRDALPPGRVAFVFPGQGSQWAGMAADLLARSRPFAAELARCDAALRPHTGWSVAAVLRGDPGAPDLARVDVVQPVLFAVMVSLAALWRSFGVEPDAVVGHSQGEVAAACVAGALTLEDAARVVALRSRAIAALGGGGAMGVVALAHDEVERRLAPGVSIAAINSARSTVVAGEPAAVERFLAEREREGAFVRRLQVDYASHSAAVEPLRDALLSDLAGVAAGPPAVDWYSTLLGEAVDGRAVDAGYWYRNLREPVRFAAAVERACADGVRWFVELSPHPSLLVAVETIAEDAGRPAAAVGSLRRDADGLASLTRSLADLHAAGREPAWERVLPEAGPVELPTYPFERERHWIEPQAGAGGADGAAGAHPLLGAELESAASRRWIFRRAWSRRSAPWLRDHAVFGRVVMSGTTIAALCQAAADAAIPERATELSDLLLAAPLALPESGTVEVQVEVAAAGEDELEVSVHSRTRGGREDWALHASAVAAPARALPSEPPPAWPDSGEPLWSEATYARLADAGLDYGPAFQGVRAAVAAGPGAILARLALPDAARDGAPPDRPHPALLDAALQAASALEGEGGVRVPAAVRRCALARGAAGELLAAVTRTPDASGDLTFDVTLWDADGFAAGRLEGVRARSVAAADLALGAAVARDLYAVHWTPLDVAGPAEGRWALVADAGDPLAAGVRAALAAAGADVVDVAPGAPLPPGAAAAIRCLPDGDAADGDAALAERAGRLAAADLAELAALARAGGDAPVPLVWITRGAAATGAGDPAGGLARAPAWGMARSARAEHPDLPLRLVDVDAEPEPGALLAALARADEPELAVRGERVLAPRLVRAAATDEAAGPPGADATGAGAVPTDGTVLVTGGLGAIGARVARRLAERGVPRIVLTSRSGDRDPRSAGVAAEVEAAGAEVEVAACDAADAGALADLLARIGDLRGVVHCAGVLADGVLAEQTEERLAAVMRPKVAGAWNLHRLTLERPLSLFVLLSSAAGVVGSAGQANYAAANVFLDRLAQRRRALGLPATAIAYGPWSGGGLAGDDLTRVASLGFAPIAPEHGVDLLELSLRRRAAHVVAATLDLDRVRASQAGPDGVPALWRALLPDAPADQGAGTLADRLARLDDAERAERVLAIVAEEAAHALGIASAADVRADVALGDLGLDSVTALELRNRLAARFGARLPATLLFDHPTPRALAGYLLANALDAGERPAAAPARPAASPAGAPLARPLDEPIAIVSMACRLPGGASDPGSLWRLLDDGRDAIGPFPADRWDVDALYDPDPDAVGTSYAREGGFLPRIDAFDPRFFGITPREAISMDPQQRLLLETAWEALERAGIVPARLAGSRAGVYLGMLGSDYAAAPSLAELDGYVGTGNALSVASGRLAYTLGLVGPAMTVDTACSSSLLALHLAASALRAGECELALVGGATVMATPRTFVEFSRLRGLSPSGRCRSFSDDADGTGFSEGVAMLVAKRLADAERDGDDVLAVVRGTAVSQDGRSQGLSVPFGPSQERVIREALERSALTPADVDYVEAHGTGTTLGDPIEANALAQVFGPSRPPGRPLRLGSVKSNLGHLQATAGLAGVMKVVLALRNERLPRTLHVAEPTRHVDWDESGLELVREPLPWPRAERPRRAGVSAFGISGTNVHVVVEEAPAAQREPAAPAAAPAGPLPFVVTARDDAALARQARRLAAAVAERPADALADVASTLARHRTHFDRRAVVLARDRDALLAGLEAVAAGRAGPGVVLPPAGEAIEGKVAFLFPGHSSRWAGMGVDLLETAEPFAAALERCDAALRRHVDWSPIAVLRGEPGAPDVERVDVTQPVMFALQCALAELWRARGVEPAAVVGHSFGEVAAAHVAGALTLGEAAAVIARRGLSLLPAAGRGGLLSVEAPAAEVKERLRALGGRLSVAAVNSGRSTSVSGDLDALAELRAALEADGVPARRVPVAFAAHSAQMDPIAADLRARLDGVAGAPAALALYSTVLGERVAGDRLDAGYWARNVREPIRFADAVERMLADGCRLFVEVAPHPALGPSVDTVAADAGVAAAAVGSLRRDEDGPATLERNLARLVAAGCDPDWSRVLPPGGRLDLPTYPFARERYWSPAAAGGAPQSATPFVRTHVATSDEPGRDVFETEVDLRDPRLAYLGDHRVAGEVWLPAAAFLEMALEAAATLGAEGGAEFADVRFEQALALAEEEPVRVQLVLSPPGADGARPFAIASRPAGDARAPWTRHVAGRLLAGAGDGQPETAPEPVAAQRERCESAVEMADVYAALAGAGIEYGEAFRRLEQGWSGRGEAVGRLAAVPPSGCVVEPTLLDAAFHAAALPADVPAAGAFVPAGVGRLRLGEARATPAWVSCRVRSLRPEALVLDLHLLDERDRLVVALERVRLAQLPQQAGSLYELRWRPRPPADAPPGRGPWLILADESGVAAALADRLGSLPHVVARRGEELAADGPGRYRLDPRDPAQVSRLLAEAFPDAPPERIVDLLALDAPPVDSVAALERASGLCCTPTLALASALAERDWSPAPRLFVVTRASQAAGGGGAVANPEQALAWGFGTAVAQERPELRTTLVDLPASGGADALWAELRHADDEAWVALRDSGRLVPRLAPTRPDGAPPELRGDRTYLVTGGLGGLGRVVAERLARLGARHLALAGRSEPALAAREWIRELEASGVAVHVLRADVADRDALAAALGELRRAAPPVAGVVHAAGVVDDATLATLTPERIARVLAPKVLGTALLDELVPEAERFVAFSSAAGLLGSAGQSAYAAANAFLDSWAHRRAAGGRPALSLDWGAWSEVGLVTRSDARAANMARSGLGSFTPAEGGDLFERLLGSERAQLVPLALDRAALARNPELVATRPVLADLVAGAPEPRARGDVARRVRAAASDAERAELLERYVRGAVAEVTGLELAAVTAATALDDLDLDSLMRVTLRNAIARDVGVELPARAAVSAADVRSLAAAIAAALPAAGPAAGDAAAAPEPAEGAPEVEHRPATRDVMRLLRAEQQGTPSVTHNIGFAVRLGAPTTRERLEEVLAGIAARHAALRTAIVADPEGGRRLEVRREPSRPLLRWTRVPDGVDADAGLRALMEPPFEVASSPLWRFELLESGSGEQVLVYGAHHAVSDAASLVLVMAELGAELSGARLGAVVSNRDVDALLEAQPAQAGGDRAASVAEFREQVAGARRLELELAGPRPAARTFRAETRFAPIPGGLLERVERRASELGVTPAAFWLGALTAFLARTRDATRFVLAVPVDTRMHVGALDAVGFFGVPVPFAAEVAPGDALADVVRRADGRLDRVLEKGASFFEAMPALVAEGLHRANAPLVEVYFNFIRPQALKVRGVEIVQAGTGYSDLDLMVSVAPDLGHVRLDYSLDVIDAQSCARFAEGYLRLVEAAAGDPAAPALAAAAAPAEAPAEAPERGSVALAATFALGHLPALLGAALGDDAALDVAEAPYHQVLASLLDPAGAFDRAGTVAGACLIRARDLGRFGTLTDELLAELAEEYPAALRAAVERTGRPVIVGLLPDREDDPRLRAWERGLAERLRGEPGIALVEPGEWARGRDVGDPFDARTDELAHLPFGVEMQAAVALELAELVRALRRTPPKVIAVDGDETLWGGVAGEVGPGGVELGGARAALARRLLEWRAAGVLLVLVSNNDEETVHAVLERPESVLRAEHFTVISAAWEPKLARLEAIADRLGLGLDSFVLLDDNPVEIAAVRDALPEVMCVTCPPAGELEALLRRLWPATPRAATREDAARADFYRQEEERRRERDRTGFAELLARLELEVDVRPLSEETLERSLQLTRRTNQFNLRPGALDAESLPRWRREGEVWTAAARDRFGDYGQVGVLAIRADGDVLDVGAWLLSCRVLGRGVEERLLGWLADRAEALGCSNVRLTAERTPRNVPARRLVAALGGGDAEAERLCAVATPAALRAFRSWESGSREAVGARGE